MFPEDVERHVAGGNDGDFDVLFADAQSQFDKAYYYCHPWSIRGLVHFATSEARRAKIVDMVLEGMWTAMYRGDERRKETSTDANTVGVGAAGVLLGRIGDASLKKEMFKAFEVAAAGHYELGLSGTYIAQALAMWGEEQLPAAISKQLDNKPADLRDSNGARLTYCLWVVRKDQHEALKYLLEDHDTSGHSGYDPKNFGNRIYAAAALADMHAADCADAIEAGILERDSLFLRRVMREAARRLRGDELLPPRDRLIWSLGVRDSLEPSDIDYFREERLHGIDTSESDTLEALFAKPAVTAADQRILYDHVNDLIHTEDIGSLRKFPMAKLDPRMVDHQYGQTLLHKAVANHYWESSTREVLLWMLEHTADINTPDGYSKDTPMHELMRKEPDKEVLRALMGKEIDLSLANDQDVTVRDAVEEKIAALRDDQEEERRLLRELVEKNQV